jgi:hypothetical protein
MQPACEIARKCSKLASLHRRAALCLAIVHEISNWLLWPRITSVSKIFFQSYALSMKLERGLLRRKLGQTNVAMRRNRTEAGQGE